MASISAHSRGPTPDVLELKLSGATDLQLDVARGQEVEVILRGVVTGHAFDDKRDKHGNVETTIKRIALKADELLEITVLTIPRRMSGQTKMGDDGGVVDDRNAPVEEDPLAPSPGELPAPPRQIEAGDPEEDVIDAEVVEEDDEGGDLKAPEPDPLDRDPLVPEAAWAQLNREQKEDVIDRLERLHRLVDAEVEAENPTDRKTFASQTKDAVTALEDDYGITLLDPADVPEPEVPEGEPPKPVTAKSGPRSVGDLKARRKYLRAQSGLPAEAGKLRDAEIAEIDRRLGAQEAA